MSQGAPSPDRAFTVRRAHWPEEREALRRVRETVFVDEQRVPLDLEWDEEDETALHALAEDGDGNPVGTGRLTRDGRIGRMAVMKDWRGRGVGSAMLQWLTDEARTRGLDELVLSAQTGAIRFYRRFGYTEEGEEFLDAGIPHRLMRRRIAND